MFTEKPVFRGRAMNVLGEEGTWEHRHDLIHTAHGGHDEMLTSCEDTVWRWKVYREHLPKLSNTGRNRWRRGQLSLTWADDTQPVHRLHGPQGRFSTLGQVKVQGCQTCDCDLGLHRISQLTLVTVNLNQTGFHLFVVIASVLKSYLKVQQTAPQRSS